MKSLLFVLRHPGDLGFQVAMRNVMAHGVVFPSRPIFCVLDRWRKTKGAQKPETEVALAFSARSQWGQKNGLLSLACRPARLYCRTSVRRARWLDKRRARTVKNPPRTCAGGACTKGKKEKTLQVFRPKTEFCFLPLHPVRVGDTLLQAQERLY